MGSFFHFLLCMKKAAFVTAGRGGSFSLDEGGRSRNRNGGLWSCPDPPGCHTQARRGRVRRTLTSLLSLEGTLTGALCARPVLFPTFGCVLCIASNSGTPLLLAPLTPDPLACQRFRRVFSALSPSLAFLWN